MSFHGSAARIWRITEAADGGWQQVALAMAAGALIFVAWCVVLCWYLFFGLLVIPYRLIRRGQRKRKMEDLRHRELLATSTAALATAQQPPPPTQTAEQAAVLTEPQQPPPSPAIESGDPGDPQ